jgi:hypothetical protein
MNATQKFRDLLIAEIEALQAFANAHGKRWKEVLSCTYWYNARIWRDCHGDDVHGSMLHGIRNEFGSEWLLDVCKIQPEKKAKA